MASSPPLVFKVRRREPVLVPPAKLTPHEHKLLSDIDDQQTLRFQVWVIHFFRCNPLMEGRDPARVVREALSKVLVFYYPLAGRLREGPGGKLIVDCNAEGALFIEADADVRLDQFGDPPTPPFPCSEELLYEVKGSEGILNCPLLLIQAIRLKCGGFILAIRNNHTMADASGTVQFMKAMAEMARGVDAPTVLPVWERTLLNARNPPHVTHAHPEYDEMESVVLKDSPVSVVNCSLFFGPREMSALRKQVPPHLRLASRFEVLTACVWRSLVIALGYGPEEEVRALLIVDARGKCGTPTLPDGYYGNRIVFPMARSTAGKLCNNPLGYAVELVRKAKATITDGYMQSVADLMVLKGRPPIKMSGTYVASDVTHAGLDEVDFGWGMPVYSGPALGAGGIIPSVTSFSTRYKNSEGEEGILVPLWLPNTSMERFVVVIESMMKEAIGQDEPYSATPPLRLSTL